MLNEKRDGKVFNHFHELEINFAPTYKYDKGTDNYSNPTSESKKREPAWCDRILWRGNCRPLCYNSCNLVRLSDHKPVFSFIAIPAKIINSSAYDMIRKDILSEIDS